MRRWNGWGDDTIDVALNEDALAFLAARIGPGQAPLDARFEQACGAIAPSRLAAHPLIDSAPAVRALHALGQSLPDWLRLRHGRLGAVPDGVACPESAAQVRELLAYAAAHGASIIPYGGGTSVAGHLTVPQGPPTLCIDMRRLRAMTAFERASQLATFGAGVTGPDLEAQLRAHGYTLGHFPQSFEYSTLGGWVVTRSSGQQSLRYGRIEALFAGSQVETPAGTLVIPTFPASAAGIDLREMVREREALLRDAPGLVEPQGFAFADYGASKRKRRTMLAGLALYDLFAGRREAHWLDAGEFALRAPNAARADLAGGIVYTDARTDDARLVLRTIAEARRHGGAAVNYLAAQALLSEGGKVVGACLRDGVAGAQCAVHARLVIDACGAWAGMLGASGPRLRPLRGSHLLLAAWRLPLAQAVSLMHPGDGRPVFAFPWEGATLVGTTDVDHQDGLAREAAITRGELDYLMAALQAQFPQLGLVEADVIATYAGVRPVVDSGAAGAPSKAGRKHVVVSSPGLVSVSGGKLTTFRAIALGVLRAAQAQLPGWRDTLAPCRIFDPVPLPRTAQRLSTPVLRRLAGRHGEQAQALVDAALDGELETIPGTETLWAELRWAARAEAVEHLDDLLLRRTRIGLLLRGGAHDYLPRIRAICQRELGWTDERWEAAAAAYAQLWRTHYSLPAAVEALA